MKWVLCLCTLFSALPSFASNSPMHDAETTKFIALSFDDAPRTANGYLSGPERAEKLIAALKANQVEQAAFFAVSQNLDDEGRARLKRYADAGHIIANHSHSHPDFNSLTLGDYQADIRKADEALSTFANFKKWYRFPYLREGNTLEKRDGLRHFLKQQGYFNAYITLNNYDWYLEALFQEALSNNAVIDFIALEALYVEVMLESIDFYDTLAVTHLGRSPKHVLLMHEMDLPALYLGSLITALKQKNWQVISITDAYTDPIAEYQTASVMPYNPGRIGEIAHDKGQTKGLWTRTLNEEYLKSRFEQDVLKAISGTKELPRNSPKP